MRWSASENWRPFLKKHSYRQLTFIPTGRHNYVQSSCHSCLTQIDWIVSVSQTKLVQGDSINVLYYCHRVIWFGASYQSAITSVESTAIVEPTQSKSRLTNHGRESHCAKSWSMGRGLGTPHNNQPQIKTGHTQDKCWFVLITKKNQIHLWNGSPLAELHRGLFCKSQAAA